MTMETPTVKKFVTSGRYEKRTIKRTFAFCGKCKGITFAVFSTPSGKYHKSHPLKWCPKCQCFTKIGDIEIVSV